MTVRVLVLGAGFGGLELTTTLSERLGDQVEVVLLDKNEGFVFGSRSSMSCSESEHLSR